MNRSFDVVGIWEGAFHNEVLEAYIHHFSLVSNKIMLFTTNFHWEQASKWRNQSALEWNIKDSQMTWSEFFQFHQLKLSTCEWLIATSLPDGHKETTKLKFPCPAWVVIHNAMYHLGGNQRSFFIGHSFVKDTIKMIRYRFNHARNKPCQPLNAFENVIFPTNAIREFCLSKKLVKSQGSAVIPFYYLKDFKRKIVKDTYTIVVPGTVNPDVRNYSLILSILPEILRESPMPIRLIFLGRIKGSRTKKIVEKISEFSSVRFQFQCFDDFIPQETFETHLSEADLILAPLQEKTRYDAIEEKFGYTTESGNIADMISHQIPGIIPSFYPVPDDFSYVVDRYDNAQHLVEIILAKIRFKNHGEGMAQTLSFPPSFEEDLASQIIKQWHDFRTFYPEVNHD